MMILNEIPIVLPHHRYSIVVGTGLLAQAGDFLSPYLPNRRTVIVTDDIVGSYYAKPLVTALAKAEITSKVITMQAGEASKSFSGLADLCDQLLAENLDRDDVVIALGGGVIGDLTGFAASIYKRGIGFIQIPTTLLAQVDSSVGGKTAIDTPRGKNLIGTFHQPQYVLADLDVLKTLALRDIRAGYAEVLKYGILGDLEFFTWLETHGGEVLERHIKSLGIAVAKSITLKADIVAKDEREKGVRALLNLGHSFGHALEAETGFGDQLLHGEAVAIGTAIALRFSQSQGFCSTGDRDRGIGALKAAGLPTQLSDITATPFSAKALLAHLYQDKKAKAGSLTLILLRGIGEAFVAKKLSETLILEHLYKEGAI